MTPPPVALPREIGDIHVELSGAGRPVLLLHGNGEDSHYFDALAAALAAHRLVVAMDSRGHGRSRRGDGPLTLARIAEDAAAVIGALAAGELVPGEQPAACDVVGFSDGANVAIELALRHPGLVRSLVLNAGNLDPSGLDRRTAWAAGLQYARLSALAWTSPGARRRWEVCRLMVREPHIDAGLLGAIAVPTLVLVGDRDVIRPAHSALIAASIPGARLMTVPDAGHTLVHDQPLTARSVIAGFLDEVSA